MVKAKALDLTLSATPCPHGASTEPWDARNNDPTGSSSQFSHSMTLTSNSRQNFILKPQRDGPLPCVGKMDVDLKHGN